ncbi:MAG: sulfite exporter TauE/SafE family protein [Desulfobacterium sp.]|nr:sulfite exporter TauE/SafE family protein [Desulfobacterium sp.]
MTLAPLYIGLSLCMAAFAFSFAGFGYGLVAVPLLALVLPVKMAVAIQFPFGVLLVLLNTWRYGRTLEWQNLKPLLLGAAIAIPLGVFSLNWFSEIVMKRALALFIVLTVLSARNKSGERIIHGFAATATGGTVLGIISGWFIGAYTAGGPPAVIYAMARFSDVEKAKGIMGIYFLITDIAIVILFYFTDVLTLGTLMESIVYTPAVVVGFLVGAVSLKRVSYRGYMVGVHVLLLIAAGMLWFVH